MDQLSTEIHILGLVLKILKLLIYLPIYNLNFLNIIPVLNQFRPVH